MNIKIKIRYHNNVKHIEKIEKGDCIDLYVSKIEVKDDIVMFEFGISMQLPSGYSGRIYPRSSTFTKYGIILTNSVGIIDTSYCGDYDIWKAQFIHLDKSKELPKVGDRIAQFEIVPNMNMTVMQKIKHLFVSGYSFDEVSILGNKNRGGYGSTGNN